MPLIPIILFIIVFCSYLKKAKKIQQDTEAGTQSSGFPLPSTPSQRYRAKKAAQNTSEKNYPTQNYPTPSTVLSASAPLPKRKSPRQQADDHLCDPGQHAEETRLALETLQMLEKDYHPYDGSVERFGSMTSSQFRRKIAELDDLKDAGIISPEEHREKASEYRALLR